MNINTVLDRQCEESCYHSPCFSAVAHGYPEIIPLLLKDGLDINGRACNEYLDVRPSSLYKARSLLSNLWKRIIPLSFYPAVIFVLQSQGSLLSTFSAWCSIFSFICILASMWPSMVAQYFKNEKQ